MPRLLGVGAVLLVLSCILPARFVAGQALQPVSAVITPTPSPHAAGAKQAGANPKPSATPEGQGASKEIPIPLPIGDTALGLKVPNIGAAGQLLSQFMAMKAKRLDEDHMELQGTKIDLNQADGKSDYHIEIPTSIFDLKTHIITSEQPVVVRTQEFELTGEKMRFNTAERSGEFIGKVHMIIHNLKATAGLVPQPTQ